MAPPVINDVATDLDDPPQYIKPGIEDLPEHFKPLIREHYSDIKPLVFELHSKEDVFEAAARTAKQQTRWSVTHEDLETGMIEGVSVTALMRFRDDFSIRVREQGSGSVVDMRSRSRLGKGDLGANAQRIRDFFKALSAELTPPAE